MGRFMVPMCVKPLDVELAMTRFDFTLAAVRPATLEARLDRLTVPGRLWRAESGRVRCVACGHRCLLAEGRRGVCKVRFNRGGELRVPHGYVGALQCDPVEKKPFFHVLPGSDAVTFGMLGCDFHCAYCQNWLTSQALRDPDAVAPVRPVTPEQIVAGALREGARLVVSSYNEPLITAEWAAAVFEPARAAGLLCAFVSNGNATPEALDFLQPWLAAYKVDLKGFHDRRYRSLGGTLEHVTATIRNLRARGIWTEVVTLLVPGFNDDPGELRELTAFLASVDRDMPWHVTAFHPDYRMTEPAATPASGLLQAVEIGVAAGLRYVYAGNATGRVGGWEDTRCGHCGSTVIQRRGFTIVANRLTPGGCCPDCARVIPGLWGTGATDSTTDAERGPRRVSLG